MKKNNVLMFRKIQSAIVMTIKLLEK